MIDKRQALEYLLEDWEKEHDEPNIVSLVHKGPARNHKVKKARDKSLQMVAAFIKKYNLTDERSREILSRAEQIQGKVHHSPKRPYRPNRGPSADRRIRDLGVLEFYDAPVPSNGAFHEDLVTPEVSDPDLRKQRLRVPRIPEVRREEPRRTAVNFRPLTKSKINSTT